MVTIHVHVHTMYVCCFVPVHVQVHVNVCTCVLHTYAREVLSSSAQAGVEARFSELEELAASRYLHLVEFKQLHQFERECDKVEQWIMEKLSVTNNEELGKDLEHVEVLYMYGIVKVLYSL